MSNRLEPPAVPEPVLYGRRATARFRSEAVLLDWAGTRLRIPLQAIETVRVKGPRDRDTEIVLTSSSPAAGTVYALRSGSAEAATPSPGQSTRRSLHVTGQSGARTRAAYRQGRQVFVYKVTESFRHSRSSEEGAQVPR
ncbi:hypothetical protein [Streptomyces sp. NPDC018031]|uniref:hypothetical protein n=1 Tax=Streptomyces sp. NPDC018031 TaxID=3365033 RepID=UPI0037ADA708